MHHPSASAPASDCSTHCWPPVKRFAHLWASIVLCADCLLFLWTCRIANVIATVVQERRQTPSAAFEALILKEEETELYIHVEFIQVCFISLFFLLFF